MTGGEAGEGDTLGPDAGAMFAMVDQWVKVTGIKPPPDEPGSALAGDARKSSSLQVGHAAWAGIVHSVDHLHALRALLGQTEILNLGAPYTLVRSAMENAATAVWLLAPSRRSERLRRRLKLGHHEAWEESKLHELLPAKALQGKRTGQERMTEIRALAVKHGIGEVSGRLSYEKIVQEAGRVVIAPADDPEPDELAPEDLASLAWRLCSGFAHGRYWASFSWLERQVIHTEDGIHLLRLTGGDVERVVTVALFPVAFISRALQLYEQRRRSPYG
jgi:hypothetical protein